MRVDGGGELFLPDFSFAQALRVRAHVTLDPAFGPVVSWHSVFFIFECFGEVARARSLDGESNPDFTITEEVRRLGI